MESIKYTTIDRIFSKLYRDLRGTDLNESDVIEWIGESLEYLQVPELQEDSVAFMEVKNHHTDLPANFQAILQIARNNDWSKDNKDCATIKKTLEETNEDCEDIKDCPNCPVPLDCDGKPLNDFDVAYYRPFFDLTWEYGFWTTSSFFRQKYTPVRLADSKFFNSIVCKEHDESLYSSTMDEYTIVGTTEKKLRFSFRDGFVALSYLKSKTDPETGYPLIPDQISCVQAITYYVKWKISEWMSWSGRQGFGNIAREMEVKWNKYCSQFVNYMRMPKTVDDYQDILEQTHRLIPRHRRYYSYFGKLNREEYRKFNDPDYSNKFYS